MAGRVRGWQQQARAVVAREVLGNQSSHVQHVSLVTVVVVGLA